MQSKHEGQRSSKFDQPILIAIVSERALDIVSLAGVFEELWDDLLADPSGSVRPRKRPFRKRGS